MRSILLAACLALAPAAALADGPSAAQLQQQFAAGPYADPTLALSQALLQKAPIAGPAFTGVLSAAGGQFKVDQYGNIAQMGSFNSPVVGDSYMLAHAALATDYNTTSPGASPSSIQFARNCSGTGDACILNAGDNGTLQGFSLYQMPASNSWGSAVRVLGVDKVGNLSIAATIAPGTYTVATLPSGCSAGQMAYASNGRNPGEGAGAGTGTPVFCNKVAAWLATSSGAAVAN